MMANAICCKGGRSEKVEFSTAVQYRKTIASMFWRARQNESYHAPASRCFWHARGRWHRAARARKNQQHDQPRQNPGDAARRGMSDAAGLQKPAPSGFPLRSIKALETAIQPAKARIEMTSGM